MPGTKPITKAQAVKLLTAGEMKLYQDSRMPQLRKLAASQLDRRVERMRELRDKSRDLLQRQRLQTRERTGNKRGTSGVANERSKQKALIMQDILRRFESQLRIARKAEAQGKLPTKTVSTRKVRPDAAVRSAQASAERMQTRQRVQEKAANAITQRAGADSKPAKSTVTTAATRQRKSSATQPPARAVAKKRGATSAPAWRDLEDAGRSAGQVAEEGFQSGAAKRKAQRQHLQESGLQTIQAHISASDRRMQAKRDQR